MNDPLQRKPKENMHALDDELSFVAYMNFSSRVLHMSNIGNIPEKLGFLRNLPIPMAYVGNNAYLTYQSLGTQMLYNLAKNIGPAYAKLLFTDTLETIDDAALDKLQINDKVEKGWFLNPMWSLTQELLYAKKMDVSKEDKRTVSVLSVCVAAYFAIYVSALSDVRFESFPFYLDLKNQNKIASLELVLENAAAGKLAYLIPTMTLEELSNFLPIFSASTLAKASIWLFVITGKAADTKTPLKNFGEVLKINVATSYNMNNAIAYYNKVYDAKAAN